MPGTVQQNLTAGGAFSNLAAIVLRWDRRVILVLFSAYAYARGAGCRRRLATFLVRARPFYLRKKVSRSALAFAGWKR